MAKIYIVRHQAEGLLWQFPFAAPPTDAQLSVLKARCDRLHGTHHAKTEEPYFFSVTELSLLGAEDVPVVAAIVTDGSKNNTAGVSEFGVSGVGHVTHKEGS